MDVYGSQQSASKKESGRGLVIKIHVLESDHYATSNGRFTIRGKGDRKRGLKVDLFSKENSIRGLRSFYL